MFTKGTYLAFSIIGALGGLAYWLATFFEEYQYFGIPLPLWLIVGARVLQGLSNGAQKGIEYSYISIVCSINTRSSEVTHLILWENIGSCIGIALCL
jgi:MFS family permease